jgi:single-strand DNA-binding protein
MSNSNQVTLFGRLGANPVLKYTQKSEPVCTFSIAINDELNDKPRWQKVVVWGKQGEDCNLHLKKGKPIFVRGQIQEKEFQSQDGLKKYTELKAETIGTLFLDGDSNG